MRPQAHGFLPEEHGGVTQRIATQAYGGQKASPVLSRHGFFLEPAALVVHVLDCQAPLVKDLECSYHELLHVS